MEQDIAPVADADAALGQLETPTSTGPCGLYVDGMGGPMGSRATTKRSRRHTRPPGGREARPVPGRGTLKLIESGRRRRRMVGAPHLVALVRAGATFVNGKLAGRLDDPRSAEAARQAEAVAAGGAVLDRVLAMIDDCEWRLRRAEAEGKDASMLPDPPISRGIAMPYPPQATARSTITVMTATASLTAS